MSREPVDCKYELLGYCNKKTTPFCDAGCEYPEKECEYRIPRKKKKRKTMKIKLDEGAFTPMRAHPTDAGLDLRTPVLARISSGGFAIIDTGVHVELPAGYYGKIESKSGLNVRSGIVSLGGTIDEPYRGSIVVKLYNFGPADYTFLPGDKVAQLIVQPYIAPDLELVDELSETDRGDKGFGSSGR